MRLLELSDVGEVRLAEDLLNSKIPPYAILSHTWGNQEVLLKDLTDDTSKKKLGYKKIRLCGEQARRDGLRYFWVDTCCIDKTSSAELQETISCMFRWYRDAAKCYVYLADVSRLPFDNDDESNRSRWKPAFRKSRWFTRGWTLQELIAPTSVEFFSEEWVQLGSKKSLEESIQEVTGIPLEILRGGPLSDFSISERMAWIEKRETTRQEDKAYSLLGIFDVHMPLLYGEGRERALIRLREEIDKDWKGKKSEREISDARSSISDPIFTIGFKLPGVTPVAQFVAREKELTKLHDVFSNSTGRRTAVIHGLGGMGKTQLAVEYAKRHQDEYSAILWFNARDMTFLKQGYAQVAERILHELPSVVYIDNAIKSHDLDQTVRAVKRWLEDPKNNRWLIIYDNYDNPLLGRNDENIEKTEVNTGGDAVFEGYDIRLLLPDTYHGAVLITSRSSRIQFGHRIPLRKLQDIGDSLEILSHTSSRQNLHKDAAAVKLAQNLDGLPLALSTAGTYLYNMPTTCADYIQMYDKSWQRLQQTTPLLDSYDKTLFSTWDISYTQVKLQNTTSAMLLRLWAYFDQEDLWFELLQKGQLIGPPWLRDVTDNIIEFNKAVRVLCDYGLAEAHISPNEDTTETRGYTIHSCVHAWTMHVLNETREVDLARLAIRCVSSKIPAKTEREYWMMQRRLIRHGTHCSTIIVDGLSVTEGEEWTLQKLGDLFVDQSRFDEAEAMYDRALQGRERVLGPDHTLTLETVNSLGDLYWRQNQFKNAEAMYDRALKGREKAFGPDNMSTLETVNCLGNLYSEQGRLDEAEGMYERALQGKEKVFGREHTSTLETINNFGRFYWEQGRLNEAEAMYDRAMRGREKVLGPEHALTLRVVNNLGILYRERGQPDKAEVMYDRALHGKEKTIGRDDVSTLQTVNNLGRLYREQGRLDEAEAMYNRALQGYEKALTPDHTSTLMTVNNLGNLYKEQGRLEEAGAMYNRALQGREKVLGSHHRFTLETVNCLGNLYSEQGRLDEAEAMYERALQGHKKAFTRKQANINLSALDNIEDFAKFYVQQHKIPLARTLYMRHQASIKAIFGVEHARYKRVTQELESLGEESGTQHSIK